jgi:hypothetical protein
MIDYWNIAKPIIEAGVLGALLLLTIRMWQAANKEVRTSMQDRVDAEKDHGKQLLKLQSENNRQMTELIRQYDSSLTAMNATLTALSENVRE